MGPTILANGFLPKSPRKNKGGVQGHKDCLVCHKHFDQEGNEIQDLSIPKLPKKATIIVINGSSNASKVEVGTPVTVTAGQPKEGMQFKGWVDASNRVVSQGEVYTFVATEDVTLTAIYERIPVDTSSSEGTNSSSSSSSKSSGDSGSNNPNSPNKNTPSSLSSAGIIAISVISVAAVASLGGIIAFKAIRKKRINK